MSFIDHFLYIRHGAKGMCNSDHGWILDRADVESVLRKSGVSLPLPECSSQGTDSPGIY